MKKKTPTRNTTIPKAAPAAKASIAAAAATPVIATPVAATPVVASIVSKEVSKEVAKDAGKAVVASAFPADQVERLRDGSVEVAVEAIEKLAASKDSKAVAPIAGVLANSDGFFHVVTRATAAMGLGKLNTPESIAALIAAATDGQAEVSREAVIALGDLKATSAVSTLVEIAENASGFYLNVVQHAAVRSLGKIKATAAKAVLTKIEANKDDVALSTAAREALAQM